jgi:hypothetical protein
VLGTRESAGAALKLSDIGFAKICRKTYRARPRGYWAKVAAGKPVPQFTFPKRGLGMADLVEITASGRRHNANSAAKPLRSPKLSRRDVALQPRVYSQETRRQAQIALANNRLTRLQNCGTHCQTLAGDPTVAVQHKNVLARVVTPEIKQGNSAD